MKKALVLGLLFACGGNDVDPRVIAGGGIGDGEIDGEINVTVVDNDDAPISGVTVRVGETDKETAADGVVTFDGVDGAQDIAVLADGFRPVMWVGANGANVTLPLSAVSAAAVPQATLSGSIPGWDTITVAANHLKAASVFYSQTDTLGDLENNLATPNGGNVCGIVGDVCNWQLTSRVGAVTLVAAIVDIDLQGPGEADNVTTVIGWASRTSVTVNDGVNQQGLDLTMVEAGNLEDVSVDFGAPPAGLSETVALVGIEVGEDEVIQLPLFLAPDLVTLTVPKPSVFSATSTYRLTAVAQTTSGDDGAQSILIQRDEAGPTLIAGDWLIPPTGVTADRDGAAWERVAGAKLHQVSYVDTAGDTLLEITVFDSSTEIAIPSLVALPTTGALQARVSGIGANLDVTDFSLDEDRDQLFAIAAEPVEIP